MGNKKGNIQLGAVILAGGYSKRMDYPKPYLVFDQKTTFLEKIVNEYSAITCKQIVIVINKDFANPPWFSYLKALSSKTTIVLNHFPRLERFYSVKLGIKELSKSDFCFIQNIDNPFVDTELLLKLLKSNTPNGYTIPVYKGKGGHPILISKNIIRHLNKCTDTAVNLRDVLSPFNRKEINVNRQDILININSPEDFNRYMQSDSLQSA